MTAKGRIHLITGGAGGLGAATARLLVAEGAVVYLADITPGDELVAELGDRTTFLQLDVTSEESWAAALDRVNADHGRLDALLNIAGLSGVVTQDGPLDTARWNLLFAINSTGPFLGIKAAWPSLRESASGAVVNVTSISGTITSPNAHPGYGASKAALRALTRIMAVEMAADGIRVNCVSPGILPVMSSLGGDEATTARAEEIRAELSKTLVPLGRVAAYEEVATAIVYLASPAASYATGAEFVIDGGYTAI